MFENTSDNSLELQKRIEHKVPEDLILKKANNASERDISVFDLIAHYAGLRHWMRDIYMNESGEEFIRTKYGFQPAVRYNKSRELAESKKMIEELQYKLKIANRKVKVCQELLSVLEERSKRRKEKIKVLLRPFQAENESLRHRINILSKELNRYKQAVEFIGNRLDALYNQQRLQEEVVEIPPSNLDWSFEDEESIESILLRYKDMLS